MSNRTKALWFGLTLLCVAAPSRAADDLYSSQIADQARLWQQKNRDDLAANLWRKLLASDPKHAEALIKLGIIEARSGNVGEAEALLRRATQSGAASIRLQDLSDAIKSAKGSTPEVAVAAPRETSRAPGAAVAKSWREAQVAAKSASRPSSIPVSHAIEPPARLNRAELPDSRPAKQPAMTAQRPAGAATAPVGVEPSITKSVNSRPKDTSKAALAQLPASKMPSAKPATSREPTLKPTETSTPMPAAETELNFSNSLAPDRARSRP